MESGRDSLAGPSRFSYAHFPTVCNAILPDISDEDVGRLLLSGPQYLNDVPYDDCVLSVASALLVADALFRQDEPRTETRNPPAQYSRATGLRQLPYSTTARVLFAKRFNASVDEVRACQRALPRASEGVKLSKDKAQPLRYVPPAD
eukprot:3839424-Alexandrium_andersonii.AAC.1